MLAILTGFLNNIILYIYIYIYTFLTLFEGRPRLCESLLANSFLREKLSMDKESEITDPSFSSRNVLQLR